MFMVSMDHSPSEQLGTGGWHTSVLISSSRVAQDELANRVAARLRPDLGTLKKWKKANDSYRRNFLATLFSCWQQVPDVQVFAQSATEAAILQSIPHCMSQMQLHGIYTPYSSESGSARVRVGPVVRRSDPTTPLVFSLSQNRADMCVFIAHFVRRVQQAMFAAINEGRSRPSELNWSFIADKFPGVLDDDMDLLFQVLVMSPPRLGRTTWGYFQEGDVQATDLLADNLAGALNAIAPNPGRLGGAPNLVSPGSKFGWEILDGTLRPGTAGT